MAEKRYKEEKILEERYGREGGWRVPEGYFADVTEKILKEKPSYPEKPVMANMSIWQRVKPYVYLAAMFAGIWCMMQVFYRVSGGDGMNLENPPARIAQIMNSSDLSDVMYIPDDMMSEVELEQEISDTYHSMTEFKAAFYEAGESTDDEDVNNGDYEE